MIKTNKMKSKVNVTKLISIMAIMVLTLSLSACKSKDPINASTFQEELETQKYTVQDITSEYAEHAHILKALGAQTNDVHIEFFEIDNKDNAAAMFSTNKKTIEGYKTGSGASDASVSNGSYEKYAVTTSEAYYTVVRVDKTMIYAYSTRDSKDTLKDIIKKLGY